MVTNFDPHPHVNVPKGLLDASCRAAPVMLNVPEEPQAAGRQCEFEGI